MKVLKARIRMLEAQDVGSVNAAWRDIGKTGQDRYMASGVIISITNLSGKELIAPVMVQDGLSEDTIGGLKADFARTMKLRLDYISSDLKNQKGENDESK